MDAEEGLDQRGVNIMLSAGSAVGGEEEGGPGDIAFVWWGNLEG